MYVEGHLKMSRKSRRFRKLDNKIIENNLILAVSFIIFHENILWLTFIVIIIFNYIVNEVNVFFTDFHKTCNCDKT